MQKLIRRTIAVAALAATTAIPASADVGLGADVVNRYVWRGTDFGNAMSIQPSISYSTETLEVGAWSSWAVNDGAANENDLYLSFNAGPVSLTLTDYFFPAAAPADFFNYSDEDGIHIIEVSAGLDLGTGSVMGAINVLGDGENSLWLEASLPLEALSSGDVDVGLTVGAGNGVYTTDTDPMVAQVSLDVSNDTYFGQYILNPDAEISFLVVGRSF
ncbi:MAG: hypothetical protein VX733_04220 [Candidatus Latescibacterota bacterium]|nr:hypothetical protein [Candidatus Latescibacterota bacterium]